MTRSAGDAPAPDRELWWSPYVLLRVEVGSTAHGTGLEGHEDYDEIGVMGLPWQHSLGLPVRSDSDETIVYRPGRSAGERSQPGDYDLTVHSSRKFCRLAAAGNPSILVALFSPVTFTTPLGDELRALAPAFWHAGARFRFLGYLRSQLDRLQGLRGGQHTNRPELIAEHGYDTKYAMHAVRLGHQGIEYMTTGRITIPCPEELGELLRAIRRGKYTLEEVVAEAEAVEEALAKAPSNAPEHANVEEINEWLDCVHHRYGYTADRGADRGAPL